MNRNENKRKMIQKIALVGLLTALVVVMSYIRIPLVSSATVNLSLLMIVIGTVLCGPWVGAWLSVFPTIISFPEASVFLAYSPVGTVITLFLKGILAGLAAGFVYRLLSKKHPVCGVICSAVVAPVVNTGVFLLGCYIFLWDKLISMAAENGVGLGALLIGLAGINFAAELILCLALCPAIIRIIQIAKKKFA
ncbi:MAG: ECF transporter S component [Clostridia bacterium]|nr:ECF transporter S component [Clostridia bacterium]